MQVQAEAMRIVEDEAMEDFIMRKATTRSQSADRCARGERVSARGAHPCAPYRAASYVRCRHARVACFWAACRTRLGLKIEDHPHSAQVYTRRPELCKLRW